MLHNRVHNEKRYYVTPKVLYNMLYNMLCSGWTGPWVMIHNQFFGYITNFSVM